MPTFTDGRGTTIALKPSTVSASVLQLHFPACRVDVLTDAETATCVYPNAQFEFELTPQGSYVIPPLSISARSASPANFATPMEEQSYDPHPQHITTPKITPLGSFKHLAPDNSGDPTTLDDRLDRMGYLEDHLAHRPSAESLVNSNVLKSSEVAASLQATQQSLLRHQMESRLDHKLATRPSPDQLRSTNILKDTAVAPTLQAAEEALRFARLSSTLEHKLERRPEKQDLVEKNVLKRNSGDTNVQFMEAQAALAKAKTQDSLGHKLELRPSVSDLIDHNILKANHDRPVEQAASDAQAKEEIQASLSAKLEQRPAPNELPQSILADK